MTIRNHLRGYEDFDNVIESRQSTDIANTDPIDDFTEESGDIQRNDGKENFHLPLKRLSDSKIRYVCIRKSLMMDHILIFH